MVNGDSAKKGLAAFRRVLELIQPVGDSNKIWLKLGKNKFIVGNYTTDGHYSVWETQLTDPNNPKSRIFTRRHDDAWEFISNWSKHNNGGVCFLHHQPQEFPINDAVRVSNSVAVELDDGTIQKQWDKIAKFIQISGLCPALIIFSANKSLHIKFLTDSPLSIEEIIYLTRLLCIALASDPAFASPHQGIRMPGFFRKETGKEQTLEYSSDHRYTRDEFLARIKRYFDYLGIPLPSKISNDRWRIYKRMVRDNNLDLSILSIPEEQLYPVPNYSTSTNLNISSTYSGQIPLDLALSYAHQEDLRGVSSYRNKTGFDLACDLIGCYLWLINHGYEPEGDPHQLFINYCQSCSQRDHWNYQEWESIWRSASSKHRTPSRGDLTNFIHWYRFNNDPDYRQSSIAEFLKRNQLDIAEPDPTAYKEYCEREEEQEKIEEAIEKSEFLKRIYYHALGLSNNCEKGFGINVKPRKKIQLKFPKSIKYRENRVYPTPDDCKNYNVPIFIFSKGQRHKLISTLSTKFGWKYILDRSFMGLGKSHDMGNFVNTDGKTWYLDLNHRNPSVSTVEDNFTDLPVRHKGLNYDDTRTTPSGKPYEVWASKKDTNPDIPPLCKNAYYFTDLLQKGWNIDSLKDKNENGVNPICWGCKYYRWKVDNGMGQLIPICAAQKGHEFGFRHERRLALEARCTRASINSLPGFKEYDYRKDIAIVEEASRIIKGTKTVIATLKDILTKFFELEQFPELYELLKPLRDKLVPILTGEVKIPKYGLKHEKVIELLGEPPSVDDLNRILEDIAKTNPEWEKLFVKPIKHKNWGKQWENSQKTANWVEEQVAHDMTLENIENVASNFLQDVLGIWFGLSNGALRIDYEGLKVTTQDFTHAQTLSKMKLVVMLDATANKKMLSLRLDVPENEIVEIVEEMPELSNLTVVNVEIAGLKGNQYSDTAIDRVKALLSELEKYYGEDFPQIGLKKYWTALDLDGNWFNDNRGSNHFKGKQAIAAIGTPRINLGVVQDEYLTLCGNLDGFDEYYQSLIDAEITQLVGRPRAHQYPDTQFIIYMIGTAQELDFLRQYGINVINRHAFEITPEAGTKKQYSKWKTLIALRSLVNSGEKITQKAVAKLAGLSQHYVSELMNTWKDGGWRFFKKISESLGNFSRTSDNFLDKFQPKEEVSIRKWLEIDPLNAVEELAHIILNQDWVTYKAYAECYSGHFISTAWGILARLIFPERATAKFVEIFGSPPT